MNKCRICGCEADAKRYDAIEMMNGTRERFTYFECPECHCLQIDNIPDDLGRFYGSDYYSYNFIYNCDSNVDTSFYNHSRILDVGCGAGAFLCQLYDDGFDNLTGCDPFIEADIHYPNGINIYKKTIHEMEGKFDWIYMSDSYEHVTDPIEVMDSIKRLLAPGGTAVISIPVYPNVAFDMFGTSWYQLDAPRHLYLHSKQSMNYLIEKAGLSIADTTYNSNYMQIVRSALYENGISYWNQTPKLINSYFSKSELVELTKLSQEANDNEYGDHAVFFITHKENEIDEEINDECRNKIAFIICSNNQQYLSECINYISMLEVPENIKVDIITINDAESITAAYQQAMKESDAKYKVYMHQDCFILNKNFIKDVIRLFSINEEYGMLGVVGKKLRVKDAAYWDKWDTGCVDVCNSMNALRLSMFTGNRNIEDVDSIDGMIMITQYDVDWREDVIKGFDFYDISQSMEFKKAGYKVGVINQDMPWCYHDCGHSKLDNYDEARKHFCDIYSDMGYEYAEYEILNNIVKNNHMIADVFPTLDNAVENGKMNIVRMITDDVIAHDGRITRLSLLNILSRIDEKQIERSVLGFDFTNEDENTWVEKYNYYKFLLRRLEYGKPVSDYADVIDWIRKFDNDTCGIGLEIIEHTVIDKDTVAKRLIDLITKDTYVQKECASEVYEYSEQEKYIKLVRKFYPLLKQINKLSGKKIRIIEKNYVTLRTFGMNMVRIADMFMLDDYRGKAEYVRTLLRKVDDVSYIYSNFSRLERAFEYMEEIAAQLNDGIYDKTITCTCCESKVLWKYGRKKHDFVCPYCNGVKNDRLIVEFLKKLQLDKTDKQVNVLGVNLHKSVIHWMNANAYSVNLKLLDLLESEENVIDNLHKLESYSWDYIISELPVSEKKEILISEFNRLLTSEGLCVISVDDCSDIGEKTEKLGIEFFGEELYEINDIDESTEIAVLRNNNTDIKNYVNAKIREMREAKSEHPLVSVILSAYNHEKYVARAIESVLNQTYDNIEFLVADDCSTDNTADIIRKYEDKLAQMLLFEKNHYGCSKFLLPLAKGKYIAIINSDDYWEPDKIESQVKYMETHLGCAACFTAVNCIDDSGCAVECDIFQMENRSREEWIEFFFENSNCLCHPSVLAKASVYRENLDKIRKFTQIPDFYLWINIVMENDIHVIERKLTNFLWHTQGDNANSSRAVPQTIKLHNIEESYVWLEVLRNIDDAFFVNGFKKYIIDKTILGNKPLDKETVMCEKALVFLNSKLKKHRIAGLYYLYEIFNDKRVAALLEEKYLLDRKKISKIALDIYS